MKIPKGMTEQQVLEIIERVASRYAHKFRFGYYTAEDIKQEAIIIGMEALKRYDEARPLENFLAVHIKNRLNNFKRDKYYRQTKKENDERTQMLNNSKKFLMEPLDIDYIRDEEEDNMKVFFDEVDLITVNEMLELIDEELDISLRADYLRIRDDVYVPKQKREEIFARIKDILKEGGYDYEEG